MEHRSKPLASLAKKSLPAPLWECLQHIFQQKIHATALVGGTALSGFYAQHRRSDDIDLFCGSELGFQQAILAVKSLKKLGVDFLDESRSAQYFHSNCSHRKHSFTIDVVLDENLFQVGTFETLEGGVVIPKLDTLFKMKIAALVSRASEKDLYDVEWLLNQNSSLSVKDWIQAGQEIDRGVTAENLLASVAGSTIRPEACHFSLSKEETPAKVFSQIKKFQKRLQKELLEYLRSQPPPTMSKLIKKLR